MKVLNRAGQLIDIHFDAIKTRIERLCDEEMMQKIEVDRVVIATINGIYDGITTSELDDLSSRIAASLQSVHHLYDKLAARILGSNMEKNMRTRLSLGGSDPSGKTSFSFKTAYIASHSASTLDPEYAAFVAANADALDAIVDYSRDTELSYFALRTLEKSYLTKLEGAVVESPQDMWMRVAVAIAKPIKGDRSDAEAVADAAKIYGAMSVGDYTHATPTLFNAGMKISQCSSCFVRDTPVLIYDGKGFGTKNIQDVEIGDLTITHLGNFKPVTQIHRNRLGERKIHRLEARCGETTDSVLVTDNHEFYARIGDTGIDEWIRADALVPGVHNILSVSRPDFPGGVLASVVSNEVASNLGMGPDDIVYTLGVEDDHSYSVGNKGMVVKNCYLLGTDDSLSGIYKTISDSAQISKWAGGIGVHVSNVRAKGARIGSTNGISDGIIPMLQVYNATARYCNQSGRRKGSIAVYLEPWHADVWEFVELKRNTGAETERARDLFLALWVPDEFMRRMEADDDWYLMSPDACPGLVDAYDHTEGGGGPDDFNTLYNRYVAEGKFVKKIKARALWQHIITSQLETGVPYVLYKDHVNRKSNQANVGTVRSSNLCVAPETQILTDKGYQVISELKDQPVKVWNGKQWSDTMVRQTGIDQPLIKVSFSNGEALECTPYHKFYIQRGDYPVASMEGNLIPKVDVVEAKDLREGDVIDGFVLPVVPDDKLLSSFSGNDATLSPLDVPINHVLSEKLRWLEILVNSQYYSVVTTLNGTPTLEIFATADLIHVKRMLDTMGVSSKVGLGGYGFTQSLLIDSYDLDMLGSLGFRPKVIHAPPHVPDSKGRRRIVVTDIRDFGRTDDTYCFTEPLEGKGVFNGILTGQCAEITEYSDSQSYAVCNLASIAVNKFVKPDPATGNPTVDHERLRATARQITYNLNRVIDLNFYPTPETSKSNFSMRPIGVGIQGFGDLYCILKLPYDDARAVQLDADVMESIYYGCVEGTAELAEIHGPYDRFEGSPASQGKLQYDMWNVKPSSDRYDWASLKERIKKTGMRNSLLTALMPTATTSQILGNCESFEPFQANVYKRTTLAGEFLVVNKHLMRDLMELGLWTEDFRRQLLASDGSVQKLSQVPDSIKAVYKTVWEVPQRAVIDHSAARGPFVDQSQSMNLFMAGPSFQKLSSALVYGWKSGLKTGVYYLRSQAAVEAIKYGSASKASTTHPSKVKGSSPRGAASGTEAAPPKASKTPRSKAAKEAAAAAAAAAAEEEPVFVCRRDDPSCEMCGS